MPRRRNKKPQQSGGHEEGPADGPPAPQRPREAPPKLPPCAASPASPDQSPRTRTQRQRRKLAASFSCGVLAGVGLPIYLGFVAWLGWDAVPSRLGLRTKAAPNYSDAGPEVTWLQRFSTAATTGHDIVTQTAVSRLAQLLRDSLTAGKRPSAEYVCAYGGLLHSTEEARRASGELLRLAATAGPETGELQRRWDLVYLLVPGLFCRWFLLYLDYLREHLASLGLDVRTSAIHTERSVAENAARVLDEAERIYNQTGKRVVLVGHSKGGCDSTQAVASDPDRAERFIAGVVTLQSPLAGTALATDLLSNEQLRKPAIRLVEAWYGGDRAAFYDLGYEDRHRALRKLGGYPWKRVPLVTFSSETLSTLSPLVTWATYLRDQYGEVKGANDGAVMACDAHLPGGLALHWTGEEVEMDHAGLGFRSMPWFNYTSQHVIEGVLTILTRQIPACKNP
eukprot:TRINITY_DN22121_c0_g1_i1.p1 TRINITY_DN22121_c0_g1~~TRINITY_DN22121_c0_g1_i1.p1  ORF type:complete len:474 (+),score=115.24 TRINITY_DN22121_c0_g1_i1:69-1424(+)